ARPAAGGDDAQGAPARAARDRGARHGDRGAARAAGPREPRGGPAGPKDRSDKAHPRGAAQHGTGPSRPPARPRAGVGQGPALGPGRPAGGPGRILASSRDVMTPRSFLFEQDGAIVRLTLNRPDTLN